MNLLGKIGAIREESERHNLLPRLYVKLLRAAIIVHKKTLAVLKFIYVLLKSVL